MHQYVIVSVIAAAAMLWAIFCTLLVRWALKRMRRTYAGEESHLTDSCVTHQLTEGKKEQEREFVLDIIQRIQPARFKWDDLSAHPDDVDLVAPIPTVGSHTDSLIIDHKKREMGLERFNSIHQQALEGTKLKRADILWALERAAALASPSAAKTETDFAWLKDAAAKLARATPQEHEFPRYLALVHSNACQAIPLRFLKRIFPEHELVLDSGFHGGEVLSFTHPLGPVEAALVVRPWVRPESTISPTSLDVLRAWRLSILVDDAILLEHPVEEFLVGPDGFGYREHAFSLPQPPSMVLKAAAYDPPVGSRFGMGAYPYTPEFDLLSDYPGWFLTAQQRLSVKLTAEKRLHVPVSIRTGLVAGIYTTAHI